MLGGLVFPKVFNWHFRSVDIESSSELRELLELLCLRLPKWRKTGQLAEGKRANGKQGWSRLSPVSLIGRELAILTPDPIRAFVGKDYAGALVSHDNWLYLILRNPIWRTAALKQTSSFGLLTKITTLGGQFVNPNFGRHDYRYRTQIKTEGKDSFFHNNDFSAQWWLVYNFSIGKCFD